MTGFSPKKRTYLSARVKRNGRDLEAEGIKFAERRALLSARPTLDAEYAVKALGAAMGGNGNGNGKGKDSRKRTAGGGVEELEKEVRFDPNSKRQPGQVFKLHVTPRDLESPDTNWGWIDPPEKQTPEQIKEGMREAMEWKRQQPKIRVRQYDQNPRTGQPILESESDIEVKSLGATIGDVLPDGSNLGGRAAQGIGLIVDALGKFRCPPGTPAANQFTDAMGSNCFSPTAVMREVTGGLASWFNRRLQRGVQVGLEDRGIDYSDAGIARLKAQTEAAGNIGDAASIAAAAAGRADAVQNIFDKYGITSGSEMNEDMWDALDALAADAAHDFEWKGLFTDLYGQELWDDDLSVRDNLLKRQESLKEGFIEFSSGDKEGRDAFRDALRQGDPTATEMMDTFLTRHDAATRGQIGSFLHSIDEDPESMKFVKEVKFRPYIESNEPRGFQDYWATRGECVPYWGDGEKRGFGVSLQFNPTAQALEPYMEGLTHGDVAKRGGKLTLIDTVGDATEAAKWQAINDFMKDQANLEQFMNTEALDMSAAIAGGVEGAAAHVGYHEIAHVKQYAQMQNMIVDAYDTDGHFRVVDGGGQMHAFSHPPQEWTNSEWAAAVNTVFSDALGESGQIGFPPHGVEQFEGSMMHILAGSMYQNELARLGLGGQTLDDIMEAGGELDPARKAQLNLMLMEGMAELAALEKMGIVKGDKVREALDWMDDPKPQAIGAIDGPNVRFLPTPMDQRTELGQPPWDPDTPGMDVTPSGLILPRNPKSPAGRQQRAKPHIEPEAPEVPDWWAETDDVADMTDAEFDAWKATQGMRSYGRILQGRNWDEEADLDVADDAPVDTRVMGTGFGDRLPTREELRSMSGPEFKEWLATERAKIGVTDATHPAYPHPALTNRHHFRDTELVPTDFFDDLPGKETGLAGVVPETRRAALDELKAEIGREGLRDAVQIYYNPETGDVNLGDGDMRIAAAREMGIRDVPTRVGKRTGEWGRRRDEEAKRRAEFREMVEETYRKTVMSKGTTGRTGKPSDIGIPTTPHGADVEKLRLMQMMYGGSSQHGQHGGMRSASFATSASAAGFGLSDNRDWGPGQLDPKKRSKLPRKDRKRYKELEGSHGIAQQRMDDALREYSDVHSMPWGEGPGLDGGRAGMNDPNSGWWDNPDNIAKMAAYEEAQEEVNEAQEALDSVKDQMLDIEPSAFRFDWDYRERSGKGRFDYRAEDAPASGMRSQGVLGVSPPLKERITDAKSGRLRDSEDRAFGEEIMNMPDSDWESQLEKLEDTHNTDPGFLNDAEYGRMTELRDRLATEHRAYEEEQGLWDPPATCLTTHWKRELTI